jgi:FkbM family methyltransferase
MIREYYAELLKTLIIFSKKKKFKNFIFFAKYIYPILIFKKRTSGLIFKKEKELYSISYKSSKKFYFYDKFRLLRYTHGGFESVGKYLLRKYQIENIEINKNKIIIEVGCNVGELTYQFLKKGAKVFAFDLEKKALECLKLNCASFKKLKYFNTGVWKNNGYKNFYSYPEDASSSFFKQKKYKIKKTKIIKLETFIKKNNIKNIYLVKVEAEGAEPEVIYGLKNKLENIRYISLDCGPERNGKTTIKEVTNFLKMNNFKTTVINNNCFAENKNYIR